MLRAAANFAVKLTRPGVGSPAEPAAGSPALWRHAGCSSFLPRVSASRQTARRSGFGARALAAQLTAETLAAVADIKREQRAHIRAVEELLRKWDPIGVIPDLAEDGGPLDEYDSYAPYIVGMLHRGADLAQLAAHLNYCRTGAMGLFPDREADMATANAILQWWQTIHGSEGPNVG